MPTLYFRLLYQVMTPSRRTYARLSIKLAGYLGFEPRSHGFGDQYHTVRPITHKKCRTVESNHNANLHTYNARGIEPLFHPNAGTL